MARSQRARNMDAYLAGRAATSARMGRTRRIAKAGEDPDKWLIRWGWITTLLFAPVGVILGVVLIARNRLGHGIAQLLISAVWLWIMLVAAAG